METNTYDGLKFQNGSFSDVIDTLTVEEAIQIGINDQPYTVTMRTPGSDRQLVRGLLYSEDIYRRTDIPFRMMTTGLNEGGDVTAVNVVIDEKDLGKGYIPTRNILSVSSCGICGKRELDDIAVEGDALSHPHKLDLQVLDQMFKQMNEQQQAFQLSGGCHAAAAFDTKGTLYEIQEDIGRHNAVDKVIGGLLEKETLDMAQCLLVSGRVSYEIVTKAFMSDFPYLASVSAPSSLAVEYAEQLGISLLSFCRDGKATCYANQNAIKRT
ncbi:MAG: formate dehydrogenase accessory sulfurtransferase FdhD [Bacteroidia bacterium]